VFGTNTKFKGGVTAMCEGYVLGVQRGVGEREEVRLRILRHPFTFREIGFGLATRKLFV
jgi:hypothetical protein